MTVNNQFDKKRFEAFIDAIIAILLTILVLEIKIPESNIENTSTLQQFKSLTPYIVSYLASFILIFGFWIDYHILFVNIKKITLRFILINMLFILSISFAPFVTAFAGKNYHDEFAVALLGVAYFIMNFTFMLVFIDAKIEKLTDSTFWDVNKEVAVYSAIGVASLLASIPLAYVNTSISFTIFIIIFSGHLLKNKKYFVT